MTMRSKETIFLLAALILSASPVAMADGHFGEHTINGNLKVMTQNLYVGADLFKVLNPARPSPI